jgi:hypothetical protein
VTAQLDHFFLRRQLSYQVPYYCQLLTINLVARDGELLANVLSLCALVFLYLLYEVIDAVDLLLQFVLVFEAVSFLRVHVVLLFHILFCQVDRLRQVSVQRN